LIAGRFGCGYMEYDIGDDRSCPALAVPAVDSTSPSAISTSDQAPVDPSSPAGGGLSMGAGVALGVALAFAIAGIVGTGWVAVGEWKPR
jgi:hypothetical protein